jgi:hypothetical protein
MTKPYLHQQKLLDSKPPVVSSGDVKVAIVPMIDGWRVRMNGKLPGTWRATEDGARQAASRWIRHQESKL